MLGIKFRRNTKSELIGVLPGEIVYAVDTDEWGLGLSDESVEWRKHVVDFENILLFGVGVPNVSLGETGFVYVDTNDNSGIYIRGYSGWVFNKHPLGREFIDGFFLPLSVGYDDTSTLFTQDASQLDTDVNYVAENNLDVVNVKQLATLIGVLRNDGSTQMVGGYVPSTDSQVVTQGNMNGEVNLVPTTNEPSERGILWNNNGIPSISSGAV